MSARCALWWEAHGLWSDRDVLCTFRDLDRQYAVSPEHLNYHAVRIGTYPADQVVRSLVDAFDATPLDVLLQSPPPVITRLSETIRHMWAPGRLPVSWDDWPPLLNCELHSDVLVATLEQVIMLAERPMRVVGFVLHQLGDVERYVAHSCGELKCAFVSMEGRIRPSPHWVTLTRFGKLEVREIDKNGALLPPKIVADGVGELLLAGGKGALTFRTTSGKTHVVHPSEDVAAALQGRRLTDDFPPVVLCLSRLERPVPGAILNTAIVELMSDRENIVRAIPHSGVGLKAEDAERLSAALLDIFASGERVTQLLVALVGAYLEDADPNSIAREDGLLTSMLRVYTKRWGIGVYKEVILPFLRELERAGDIRLGSPGRCEVARAKDLVFGLVDRLDPAYFSLELRHLASVVKYCCALRFNSRGTTCNALSGLFYLRFVLAIVTNPVVFDPLFQPERMPLADLLQKVTIPFAQLATNIFNQNDMSGRYEAFSSWNDELRERVYPRLRAFLDDISAFPGRPVVYKKPAPGELGSAIIYVLQRLTDQHEAFVRNMRSLEGRGGVVLRPFSWAIGVYILSLFRAQGLG